MSGILPDPSIVDAEADLLTAEASAVDGPPTVGDSSNAQLPIGRTWSFDFSTGRFRRRGLAPAEVSDRAALGIWIETVVRVGRFAYAIFSDEYGLDEPEVPFGELITPAKLADLAARLKRAITTHDRIDDVVDIRLRVDGDVIYLDNLTAIYDETNSVVVQGAQLT